MCPRTDMRTAFMSLSFCPHSWIRALSSSSARWRVFLFGVDVPAPIHTSLDPVVREKRQRTHQNHESLCLEGELNSDSERASVCSSRDRLSEKMFGGGGERLDGQVVCTRCQPRD